MKSSELVIVTIFVVQAKLTLAAKVHVMQAPVAKSTVGHDLTTTLDWPWHSQCCARMRTKHSPQVLDVHGVGKYVNPGLDLIDLKLWWSGDARIRIRDSTIFLVFRYAATLYVYAHLRAIRTQDIFANPS